jgi:hypothetical protein
MHIAKLQLSGIEVIAGFYAFQGAPAEAATPTFRRREALG